MGKCLKPTGEAAAQDHLDLGNRAYAAGSFEAALGEYRAAYELCSSAMVLFGIASSEARLGRDSDAARNFQRFLREAPDADGELRDSATKELDDLARRLTVVDVVGAVDHATVFVDRAAVEGWAAGTPIYLSASSHTLRIAGGGLREVERVVNAIAGAHLRIDVAPSPAAALVNLNPPPPPRTRTPYRWWLWGGLATIVIGGAVATYFVTRPDRPTCTQVACF